MVSREKESRGNCYEEGDVKREYKLPIIGQSEAELFVTIDTAQAGVAKDDMWSLTDEFILFYIKSIRPEVFKKWRKKNDED